MMNRGLKGAKRGSMLGGNRQLSRDPPSCRRQPYRGWEGRKAERLVRSSGHMPSGVRSVQYAYTMTWALCRPRHEAAITRDPAVYNITKGRQAPFGSQFPCFYMSLILFVIIPVSICSIPVSICQYPSFHESISLSLSVGIPFLAVSTPVSICLRCENTRGALHTANCFH